MGLSFRQKLGPFTISWSRTKGWNVSAGGGGLHVGANAQGSYLSANKNLGGTPLVIITFTSMGN
jgi:hypothetical protein